MNPQDCCVKAANWFLNTYSSVASSALCTVVIVVLLSTACLGVFLDIRPRCLFCVFLLFLCCLYFVNIHHCYLWSSSHLLHHSFFQNCLKKQIASLNSLQNVFDVIVCFLLISPTTFHSSTSWAILYLIKLSEQLMFRILHHIRLLVNIVHTSQYLVHTMITLSPLLIVHKVFWW